MNCEKCKNKKATVFYADEGGGRHSLCAACSASRGKQANLSFQITDKEAEEPQKYIPEPTLSALTPPPRSLAVPNTDGADMPICRGCGLTLEGLITSFLAGCPECYDSFATYLFPMPVSAQITRMPAGMREELEKKRLLLELKEQLREAVKEENYELAATLRDRCRKLEAC